MASSSPPPQSPVVSQASPNQSIGSPLSPSSHIDPDLSSLSGGGRRFGSSALTGRPLGLNYSIATHSVRITKHGYAIEPSEIQYPEVINNLSAEARRKSEISFDSSQVGHKILALIRGFWSQPAFPRGRARRLSDEASVTTLLSYYKQFPFYPHKYTMGSMARYRVRTRVKSRNHSPIIKSKDGLTKTTHVDPNYIRRLSAASMKRIESPPPQQSPSPSSLADATSIVKGKTSDQSSFVSFSTAKTNLTSSSETSPPMASPPPTPSLSLDQLINSPGSSASPKDVSPSISRSSSQELSIKKSNDSDAAIESVRSQPNTYVSWIPKEKERLAELIAILCNKLEVILSKEPRVLNLESPCIVLGDIHGNLTDLRTYERSLWPKAPNCTTNNYLFLGDYVDRGDYSIECVLYLFSMKLISPRRFYLLRGNHEVAALQLQYTFCRECEVKFGMSLGRKLWRLFNRVFNVLPLAALIDNQIFCAHGGIPKSVTEVSQLSRLIPAPLDNPEQQCAAAWEILWNDPITDSELIGMIEMDNVVTQTRIVANNHQTQSISSTNSDPVELTRSEKPIADTASSSTAKDNPETGTNRTNKDTAAKAGASIATKNPNDYNKDVQAQSSSARANATSDVMSNSQSNNISNTNTNNNNNESARSLKGSDSILAREAASAISNYIRPDSQQPTEPLSSAIAAKVISRTKQQQQTINNIIHSNDTDVQTLRKVPSDTSSIASTSPQQIINDGFVSNIKRGTAYLFSDQAINNFLRTNKLSHVIRAHEVIPTGFAFHGDGRVITIFSSSKYCGLNNQAACALVDNNLIRILRLDTSDVGE